MSKEPFVKGMGCLGSLLTVGLAILCGYLSMHFGWGLEVKSWSAYIWFGIAGQIFLFALGHLFARLGSD